MYGAPPLAKIIIYSMAANVRICDGRVFICDGHKYMRWLCMHAIPKRIGDGDVLLVEATDKAHQ